MTPDSSPTDLDAVFGHDALDDPGLEAVRELFDGLRSDFASGPPPVPRADLAALLGTAPEPVRADDRADDRAVVTLASRVRSRGIRFRRRIVAGAAALVAAAGITSGLAAAQALPAPLQHVVADALDHIGIHVDGGSKPAPHTNVGPAGPSTHGSSTTAATTTTPGGNGTPGAPGASATVPTSLPGLPPAPGGLPPVTLPGVTLPPISVPVTLPHGSPVNVPQVPLPPLSLPGASLPGASLPAVSLPRATLPRATLPRPSLPPLTLPVQLPPVTPPTLPHLFG